MQWNSNEKQKKLAAKAEVDEISRYMLTWANTFPEKPVSIINYEFIKVDAGDETGMALSTIQGAYITGWDITGAYEGEYQFKLIYRIRPGNSNDKRLSADELLNRFGDWAMEQKPDLGPRIRAVKVEPTTQSSKFAEYQDGYEDYQILMRLEYQVPA